MPPQAAAAAPPRPPPPPPSPQHPTDPLFTKGTRQNSRAQDHDGDVARAIDRAINHNPAVAAAAAAAAIVAASYHFQLTMWTLTPLAVAALLYAGAP